MNRSKKAALLITETAAGRIRELIKMKSAPQTDIYGIKVGVRRRGCNGYSYVMNYCEKEDEVAKLDEVVED